MKPNFRTQLERNLLNIAHTGLLSSNSAGQYGHHFQTFPGEPSVFFVFVVLQDCHNSSRLLHNRADYSAYLDPMSLIKIEHRAEHSRPRVSTDRRCPRWRCRQRPSARLVSFPGSHRLQALCGGAPDRHHVAPPTEARLYRIAHLNSGYAERERRHPRLPLDILIQARIDILIQARIGFGWATFSGCSFDLPPFNWTDHCWKIPV